ncbi:hypothetical protein SAMN04487948_11284 [Halogranum amylolyticum]|uniref:Uncharacterized protein n=1 Tax=Halogranum amylolyticum TaxID=660520 RepID=A0A1H8UU68_9EURY|nr:hypothetical protein [Halogranum amylolyticum]SEP06118.1 hypothetical protein SAMN04487948_11284 [Halogranum amylolyticum]
MTSSETNEWFVTGSRLNAIVAWAVVAVVAATAVAAFFRANVVDVALALTVVAVAAVPAVVSGSWTRTMPWPMVLVASIPLLVRVSQPSFLFEIVVGLSLATLAMLVVTALQMTTPIRMTPNFAVGVVVVATLGLVGFWAVSSALSSRYLGTAFFGTNQALMYAFAAAATAGILAGFAFRWYFARHLATDRVRQSPDEREAV